MTQTKLVLPMAVALALAAPLVQAAPGDAGTSAQMTIGETTSSSPDHTTLKGALQAADLGATLDGSGPYTLFAPTNAAFAQLPSGTVETLLEPGNKAQLTEVLTYHVVPGRLDAAALRTRISEGKGKAALTTVEGEKLTVTSSGSTIMLTDAKGGTSRVTQADLSQSNGVIHIVDKVSMPNGTPGKKRILN